MNPFLAYFAVIIIFFGINHLMNFLRPISNIYQIYFALDIAEFQFLEFFDILNLIFGSTLIILGFALIYFKYFNRNLLIFSGIVFFLYQFIDPSHILILGSLISVLSGNPPVWMSLIPENTLGVYLSSWSILSVSNLLLEITGIILALLIIINSKPLRAIVHYFFFYCWVSLISGIVLWVQSFVILSLTASWASMNVISYLFRLATWIFMCLFGISGMLYFRYLSKNTINKKAVRSIQVSLFSYSLMLLFISFSDIAMKTVLALVINSIIAGIMIYLSLKIPKYLESQKKGEEFTPSTNHTDLI